MDPALYDLFYEIERSHWWSVGMRGIFHMLVAAGLRGVPAPRLIDVGCGTGITVEEFSRYGRLCGFDAVWQAVQYTKHRNPGRDVCQANLLHLPVATAALDAVLAFDVIEHLEDDHAALREMHRVLRPNGIAVINVPAFASLWSEKDVANHHRRRYTSPMLRQRVERAGLRVERITYTNAVLFPAVWCARTVQRLAKRPWNREREYQPHPWVNAALIRLLRWERAALRYLDFPFGTSVTCLARRMA